MPQTTEIEVLTDLILDLHVQHVALATLVCRKCPNIAVGDLRDAVNELRQRMESIPQIQKLRQVADLPTLEAAAQVLKDFRV